QSFSSQGSCSNSMEGGLSSQGRRIVQRCDNAVEHPAGDHGGECQGGARNGRERRNPATGAGNLWWRRRELNPRPRIARAGRLRVYLRLWISRLEAPLSWILKTPAR